MEATRLSNTKGLIVPLDYASTILARVEAERDALRAENARLVVALSKIYEHARQIPMGEEGSEQWDRIEAIIDLSGPASRAALAGSR